MTATKDYCIVAVAEPPWYDGSTHRQGDDGLQAPPQEN